MVFNVIHVARAQSVLNGVVVVLGSVQYQVARLCPFPLPPQFGLRHSLGGKLGTAEIANARGGKTMFKFCVFLKKDFMYLFIFKDFIYLFLERGEGREKERETSMCGCHLCAPYWGPGLQPRHVP